MTTEKRGRKKLPKGENIVPVRIFVKEKNLTRAKKECAAIANKYR
jgi:hypothetical protein